MDKTNNKSALLQKVLRFFRENKAVIFFILKLAAAWILWKLFIWFAGQESDPIAGRIWPWFSQHWEIFNDWIRIFLLKATWLTLQLLGYSAAIYNDYVVKIEGYCGVGIGNYCLGLQLWFIMAMLILLYPNAKMYVRLIFTIAGIALINVLNILRLVTLSICTIYLSPAQLAFNHDFIFNLIVYFFTFLLYLWFIRKYGNYTRDKVEDHSVHNSSEK